ncbi:MAG TPA: ABC transporter permease [Longimicrobium sp.]
MANVQPPQLPARPPERKRSGGAPAWLALPYLGVWLAAFAVPFGFVVAESVDGRALSWRHYERLLREPVYADVFLRTIGISALITLCCLLLGYPLALLISGTAPRMRRVLLAAVLVPFWMSLLARTYAWLVLLQRRGVVNQLLTGLHVTVEPLPLVHSLTGVILGMTYVLLPYMVLSLCAALARMDPSLPLAAATLGADRLTVFWRIVLPLTARGAVAGSALVFVLGLGFFITPALLGGPRETMVGVLIDAQLNRSSDAGLGAAVAVCLTLIVVLTLVFVARWVTPRQTELRES